jgi:RNA polymerase sigma-70 factor, ECF subfamily
VQGENGNVFLKIRASAGGTTEGGANQVTHLLALWSQGDQLALGKLMPLVYGELHRQAERCMAAERPGHTLQTAALINEAYLRLAGSASVNWESQTHFFGVCAQVMRRILVDWARARQTRKRGGNMAPLELDEALAAAQPDRSAIDDVLQALAEIDPRKARVVELRFFGGLSVEETAQTLDVSVETVHRDWKLAKIWLRRELSGGPQRSAV